MKGALNLAQGVPVRAQQPFSERGLGRSSPPASGAGEHTGSGARWGPPALQPGAEPRGLQKCRGRHTVPFTVQELGGKSCVKQQGQGCSKI